MLSRNVVRTLIQVREAPSTEEKRFSAEILLCNRIPRNRKNILLLTSFTSHFRHHQEAFTQRAPSTHRNPKAEPHARWSPVTALVRNWFTRFRRFSKLCPFQSTLSLSSSLKSTRFWAHLSMMSLHRSKRTRSASRESWRHPTSREQENSKHLTWSSVTSSTCMRTLCTSCPCRVWMCVIRTLTLLLFESKLKVNIRPSNTKQFLELSNASRSLLRKSHWESLSSLSTTLSNTTGRRWLPFTKPTLWSSATDCFCAHASRWQSSTRELNLKRWSSTTQQCSWLHIHNRYIRNRFPLEIIYSKFLFSSMWWLLQISTETSSTILLLDWLAVLVLSAVLPTQLSMSYTSLWVYFSLSLDIDLMSLSI